MTLRKMSWTRILVQVTINRRLLIGRDDHLDQSEAYNLCDLIRGQLLDMTVQKNVPRFYMGSICGFSHWGYKLMVRSFQQTRDFQTCWFNVGTAS